LKTPRRKEIDLAIYILIKGIMDFFRFVPRRLALRIFYAGADLARLLDRRHRNLALSNLDIAFPELPKEKKETIAKESFRNLGRLIVETTRLPLLNRDNIERLVEYHPIFGLENYHTARQGNRSILFLGGHFGAWELHGAAHAIYGYPGSIIVRPVENRYLDALLIKLRCCHGNQIIPKRGSIKTVLSNIRKGIDIGILSDQRVSRHEGIWVDFFGHRASSSYVVPALAMRTGCPVILSYLDYDPKRDKHTIVIKPPLEFVSTGNRKSDLLANTQICMNAFEEIIRERPEIWLWMHSRWKRRDKRQKNKTDKKGDRK
jgi:KDO2-lipid IV(A) lauroyltransferase